MENACAFAAEAPSAALSHPSGWVLVVEDDADLRGLVALSIEEVSGLQVKAAGDGLQALEQLDGDAPAVVVTDLMMPRMDGGQLLERLRGQHPALPVVAMSAVESRARAMSLGFDAFLVKPFELEELCAVLARWVTVL